jgi:hypothetical protein
MDCEFKAIGKAKDGRTRYACTRCKQGVYLSFREPSRIHRQCQHGKPEPPLKPIHEDLPEESRQLLFGDRIKQLTDALGIPQCGGCAKRQEWLNNAHQWVLKQWG